MSINEAHALAKKMIYYSLIKKAKDICLLNMSRLSSMADFFIICHGESDVQVKAIVDSIMEGMESEGVKAWHREGYSFLNWVLLDYVDVVVHVFQKEARKFYRLERLWGDAEIEKFGYEE